MDTTARTRQIIYIAVGVVSLALIGYLIFRLFFSGGNQQIVAPQQTQAPTNGTIGELPAPLNASGTAGNGQIPPPASPTPNPSVMPAQGIQSDLVQLTDFSVLSPSLTKDESKVQFYKKDGGHLFVSDFFGEKQEASNLTIVGMLDAQWSSLKDRALISYLEGDTVKMFLAIGTSSVVNVGSNIRSVSWSPTGKEFSYTTEQNGKLQLVTGDSKGKNLKVVYQTPVLDAQATWISANTFALQTAPSGFADGYIFIYSRSNGSFRRIMGPTYGMESIWSPDGSRAIVTSTNATGKDSHYVVLTSSGSKSAATAGLLITEKCVWANLHVMYCALPRNIPENAVLPDSYLRGELATQDRLVRLDLDAKQATYVLNDSTFDMTNLLVTKNEGYLIFVNKPNGTLWRLKLK